MFSRRTSTVVTVVIVALVTIGLVASALPVFASPASALPMHARLVSTTPADGDSVETAESVTMTFSEDVNEQFLQVAVSGPDGSETDGRPSVDGATVTQALAADLPAGEHEVTYRVVSVDGHPVSGSLTFTTTQTAATPSASPSTSASPSASATAQPDPTPSPATEPTSADEGSVPWVAIVVGLALGVLLGTVLVRLVLARARRGAGPPPAGD